MDVDHRGAGGGHIGLDGVGERVQPSAGGEIGIHGQGDLGIDQGDIRDHGLADDSRLAAAADVVDDGELRDVGGGSRRGGDADERWTGQRDPIHAGIVEHLTAIADDDADALGAVDHATAADGEDDVASLVTIQRDTRHDLVIARVRGHAAEDPRLEPCFLECRHQVVQPAGLNDPRIRDDQQSPGLQVQCVVAGTVTRPRPEDELRRDEFAHFVERHSLVPRCAVP